MNTKQILAVGISIAFVIFAIAIYKLTIIPAQVVELGGKAGEALYHDTKSGVRYAMDKCQAVVTAWGQPTITSSSQNDCLEVKPITELAFSKVRVRSIVDYKSTVYHSEKRIIAHQAFDIRLGWSSEDAIAMIVDTNQIQNTVRVIAPPAHHLTITKVEETPVVLYESDGLLNKLTPGDGIELQRRLESEALRSADWNEGRKVAKDGFESFLRGLFRLQGLEVIFDYTGQPDLTLPELQVGKPKAMK